MEYDLTDKEMSNILARLVVNSPYHGDQEKGLLNFISELEEIENIKTTFGALSPLLEKGKKEEKK